MKTRKRNSGYEYAADGNDLIATRPSGDGFIASIISGTVHRKATWKDPGKTVLGIWPTREKAIEAAKVQLAMEDCEERVCTLADIDRVRRENVAKQKVGSSR